MRIVYHLSSYISHRLAGLAYARCLIDRGHDLSFSLDDVNRADAVILHDEPPLYPALFQDHPALRHTRTIAFCVWENEILPEAYARPLELVDEIWTPSAFSHTALAARFARACILPHLVRRGRATEADMAALRTRLAPAAGFRFYSITDAANPRKNVLALLAMFGAVRKSLEAPVSLVLKLYRRAWTGPRPDGVLFLDDKLEEGEMAALHRQCHAYVSAHHAEGWGLGLSEAMAFGRPVIATGWSGNMDFMNFENSVPVPYSLEAVSEAMIRAVPCFGKDMRWAVPDPGSFIESMRLAALGKLPASLPEQAAKICQRFGPEAIGDRLEYLLTKSP
ncbi:glycosyltransferase [Desulfovibrio sp. OttesenSCG-928-F20]|nr:glycosyltransferase [Desulfovibrio sp. OttesenSCG-928-M16]MDL2290757.1 glycosyltransferase [Desulfovibrio sp. OttesenSCG-928-F20]